MRRFAAAKALRLYISVSPGPDVSRLHKRVGVDATPGAKESTHEDHFGNDPRRRRDDDERRIRERSRWRQCRLAARTVGEFVGSERQVSPSLLVASSPPRLPLIQSRRGAAREASHFFSLFVFAAHIVPSRTLFKHARHFIIRPHEGQPRAILARHKGTGALGKVHTC